MRFNRILRIFGGSILAAALVCVSSPVIAEAAPSGATATASLSVPAVRLDPVPGPPWVFYITGTFNSESACKATGQAFVRGKQYTAYTCRFVGGKWRLYLLPAIGTCHLPSASLENRPAAPLC
jgi:hypothetical protein